MRPSISVVMGVYNGAKHLRKSVESIITQEAVDFEFIIVNDGSTDESGAMLDEYRRIDNRLKVIHQDNKGLTSALIRGCKEACGRYIARHDADDLSFPSRLHKLERMLQSDAGLVLASSWAEYIGPLGELIYRVRRPADSDIATRQLLLEKVGPPAHGSVMFRKDTYELVGGYREEFYYGQDSDLWLRMAQAGRIGYVQEYLYAWRYSPEAISSAKRLFQEKFGRVGQACHGARQEGLAEDRFLAEAFSLRKEILGGNRNVPPTAASRASGNYFIGSGLYELRDPAAFSYLLKTVRLNPLHLRAWAKLLLTTLRCLSPSGKGAERLRE